MMTEREYVEALVNGMREQMRDAEERAKALANPATARQFMEDQRVRSLELLDSLVPPRELEPLHARLRLMAENSLQGNDDEDQTLLADILQLAQLAERYGLQLVPGMSAADVEESVRKGAAEQNPEDDISWEGRLRRTLIEDAHPDVEGVIERMRQLRADEAR